jgi:hypothetical protein
LTNTRSPSKTRTMPVNPKKEADEDAVELKPVFGIRPGIYLAVLYTAIILFILFLVLLYPGLSKPGSLGVFRSEPSGAAVRIDGVTRGTAPCEVFIPKGKHTVKMVLPGFTPFVSETEFSGRILGSKFFPARTPVAGTLTTADPLGALAAEAAEYARWSLAMEPTESWQIPQSLSEGVYRTGPELRGGGNLEEAELILEASLRFASTRAAARDLVRAQFLLDNAGLSPSPLTLIRSVRKAAANLENIPGAASWLAGLLPTEAAAALTGSAWYRNGLPGAGTESSISAGDIPAPLRAQVNLNGQTFIFINGGTLTRPGRPEASVPPLFMALTEVSLSSWEGFSAENPRWEEERRDELVKQGLVQDDYLRDPGFEAYPYPAAPGISWYAAAAYCAWLTEKLPPELQQEGWTVTLPLEEEWEFAARYFSDDQPEMTGGLWEWCGNPFAPLDFFPLGGMELFAGEAGRLFPLERAVRGGSWINPPGSIGPGTRGSLPPGVSSPFTGFRPFIVQEADRTGAL